MLLRKSTGFLQAGNLGRVCEQRVEGAGWERGRGYCFFPVTQFQLRLDTLHCEPGVHTQRQEEWVCQAPSGRLSWAGSGPGQSAGSVPRGGWGGAGLVWLRVPQRWDEAPGRGLNSECGDDRGLSFL